MSPALRRHDLAYLRPEAPVCAGPPDEPAATWLRDWLCTGRPLVVTRQEQGADGVRLGAVLPARLGRRRLSCVVDHHALTRIEPPLPVAAVLEVLPRGMVGPLQALAQQARDLGVSVGVYGSTAWEKLAGECYRRASSDLDVVCDVAQARALSGCLSALARADEHAPIDGEIRFPDGRAVAWRELHRSRLASGASVLAKDLYGVALVSMGSLLEALA